MYRKVQIQIEHGPSVVCYSTPELAIHPGDLCVIKSDRILEIGRVTGMENVDAAPPESAKNHSVLRRATLQDQAKASENALMSRMAQDSCQKKMVDLKLEARLIGVRYSFDRTVLMITSVAEERMDFRDLIQRIESELHAHVDVKQLGVRDAAKLIGGVGPCGQRLCCNRWLQSFDAVSVKMAKVQKLSLSPSTISGMCGRLKCCLRYEHECYRTTAQRLPRDGDVVECPAGRGRVIDTNILGERVKVRMDDERVMEYGAGEVKALRRA